MHKNFFIYSAQSVLELNLECITNLLNIISGINNFKKTYSYVKM